LAGILFVWAFGISLDLLRIPLPTQGLAFVLVACIVYIPIAIYLNKFQKSREKSHPMPIFVIGYLLSIFAVYSSIFWSFTDSSVPWIAVAVPLIATALYVFSEFYFRTESYSIGWAWLAALTLALTFRQTLTLFQSPTRYDAFAWTAFAAMYMIVERLLSRISEGTTKRF